MKEVPLSRGLVALVDDEDYGLVSQIKWHAAKGGRGGRWYATACLGRAQAKEYGRRHLRMHRLILGYPDAMIDHRDRNGLNNQRSNLRIATNQQNQANKYTWRGKSRFKGVSWHRRSGRWQVFIQVDGKNKHLGDFRNPIQAAFAYDDAAVNVFGEYACLNFPERVLGVGVEPTRAVRPTGS